MIIMGFNIRQGGGNRVESIIKTIEGHNPDVLVLTEFRENKNSNYFRTQLNKLGYIMHSVASIEKGLNTVLIAAKKPFITNTFQKELQGESHRLLVAKFADITIAGVYFAQKNKKKILFDFLQNNCREILGSNGVIIGDFNTGKHMIDEQGKTFYCASEFEDLEANGLVDSWRTRNLDKTEYSWFSTAGNGFRIDHAFMTPSLDKYVEDVHYSHKERENGISDHSSLIMKLNTL